MKYYSSTAKVNGGGFRIHPHLARSPGGILAIFRDKHMDTCVHLVWGWAISPCCTLPVRSSIDQMDTQLVDDMEVPELDLDDM